MRLKLMHTFCSCAKIVSLAASLAVLGAGSYACGADFGGELLSFEEKQIYHSPETPGFTCWVGMWQMPNGPIQCEFSQRTSLGNTRPVFQTTDVGQTWTPVPGNIPTGFCRRIAVLEPNGQTMVRPNWGNDGCVERSLNGGQTWNGPIRFLPVEQYRSWPTVIKPLSDGRLVLYAGVYERDPNNPNPDNNTMNANCVRMMFISTDQGKTWGTPITLVPKSVGTTEEGDFVELPNGNLLFMHRMMHFSPEGKSSEDKMVSIATKSGDTFMPGPAWVPFSLPDPLPNNSPGFPAVVLTTEGVILDLSHSGSHYSNDLGQTWKDLMVDGQQLVTPYYPQAVQAEDGTIMVVGHRGGDDRYGTVDQAIIQQTFRVSPALTD